MKNNKKKRKKSGGATKESGNFRRKEGPGQSEEDHKSARRRDLDSDFNVPDNFEVCKPGEYFVMDNSFINDLSNQVLECRKARDVSDKASYATALLNDIKVTAKDQLKTLYSIENKEFLESVVIRVNKIKKVVEKVKEQSLDPHCLSTVLEIYTNELAWLAGFLPCMLTETETIRIIKDYNLTTIGSVMAYFKNNYLGRYDSKSLAALFNTLSKNT